MPEEPEDLKIKNPLFNLNLGNPIVNPSFTEQIAESASTSVDLPFITFKVKEEISKSYLKKLTNQIKKKVNFLTNHQ